MRALRLHPDRLSPPDPAVRAMTRHGVVDLALDVADGVAETAHRL
jgi:hypothetical protein